MFFFLSKILLYFLMPITWVLVLLLAGCWLRNMKWRRRCLGIGVALLVFFTNPAIINEIMLQWEREPIPVRDVKPHQVAVILTGVTNVYKSPKDRVYFRKGADRILHPLLLFRLGKIRHFLISGGTGSISNPGQNESEELRKILLLAQVPDSLIWIENKSKNTHENALYTAKMLNEKGVKEPVLLVTSAFHMRRSAACFRKQGVVFDAFTTDFSTVDRSTYTFDRLFVPLEEALYQWQTLMKELFGLVSYRLMGYI